MAAFSPERYECPCFPDYDVAVSGRQQNAAAETVPEGQGCRLLRFPDDSMLQMVQEIQIHRGLSHPHVVQLMDYFEDDDNVYIILELCARRLAF